MTYRNDLAADGDASQPRRIPCLVAYLEPFRTVHSACQSPWQATIDQVNTRSWDYIGLHEIAGGIDVGLGAPYHLVVGRDGALALPPIEMLRSHRNAVEYFNQCLAALLIGGIYCEAITPDGLDRGSIIDWAYIRSGQSGVAASNRFHQQIRLQQASAMEAASLLNPRTIALSDMATAMEIGLGVLAALPTLHGEYLLKGSTGIARRDWGAALTNLWIAIEQVIALLWQREVVVPKRGLLEANPGPARKGRRNTESVAFRIETLIAIGVLPMESQNDLAAARKARNCLSHKGIYPSQADACAAHRGLLGLLEGASGGQSLPISALALADHSISDPFVIRPMKGIPKFWMEIPKLPGEQGLEREEAELREDTG